MTNQDVRDDWRENDTSGWRVRFDDPEGSLVLPGSFSTMELADKAGCLFSMSMLTEFGIAAGYAVLAPDGSVDHEHHAPRKVGDVQ